MVSLPPGYLIVKYVPGNIYHKINNRAGNILPSFFTQRKKRLLTILLKQEQQSVPKLTDD
jgi:hypothetical protein